MKNIYKLVINRGDYSSTMAYFYFEDDANEAAKTLASTKDDCYGASVEAVTIYDNHAEWHTRRLNADRERALGKLTVAEKKALGL